MGRGGLRIGEGISPGQRHDGLIVKGANCMKTEDVPTKAPPAASLRGC